MSMKITRHQDLDVYRKSFEAAMQIFEASKQFPKEETYSLTDQIRRLAETSLRSGFRQQDERFGKRSRRNANLA